MLPSNQKQILEQTKFTYSPLSKAFEKQTKTIEKNEKNLKYKEVFNELPNIKIGEIYDISKEINFNHLNYHFKGPNTAPINFIDFKGPMHIYNEIKMVIYQ